MNMGDSTVFLLYRQYLEEYIHFRTYIGVNYTQLINVPAN